MWLLVAFLSIPLIEIALFIQVGGFIGLWPTLGIVVLTAILGTWLVRSQGAQAMANLRSSFSELRDPTEPLAHGAMILVSGVLLLTPGFFTDAVGFALLAPPIRQAVYEWARKRVTVQQFEMGSQQRHRPQHHHPRGPIDGDVVEGEYTEVKPGKRPTHQPPSGWTKH
ncbi:FxsA family protein [Primorskyibacter sedentarius]|uniref:UPF0716 protein FxsA n=1 Tax=Primorskyibacter sedentarius TaxID=745311 RepID=A0A4R3JJF7_9RHOB|nr:FxsA family protein [Primorskyibacter sedentarius]TCS66383.1 UPF0716 protein FxsA [Primorskyibacter sedentarius]